MAYAMAYRSLAAPRLDLGRLSMRSITERINAQEPPESINTYSEFSELCRTLDFSCLDKQFLIARIDLFEKRE